MITSAVKLGSRNDSRHYHLQGGFRQSQPFSATAVPLTLLLLLLLRQTFFQRTRGIAMFSTLDAFNIPQIFLAVLAAAYLFLKQARLGAILRQLKGASALSMYHYYIFACISALWSTRPLYSFYMAAETILFLMLTLVLFSKCQDFYQAERLAIGLAVLSIAFEIGTALYRGGLSFEAIHTNTYSCSAAMLLVYGVGEALVRGRKVHAPIKLAILAGSSCLIAGTSTGSNIACFMALALICIGSKGFGMKRLILAGGLCVLALVVALEPSEWAQLLLGGKSLTSVISAEHRLDIWQKGLDISLQSVVFGYGFGVGPKEYLELTNAHNTFLELAMNTGILGVGLFSFALWKLTRELFAARNARIPGALGCAGAFAAVVLNSLGVSVLALSWSPPAFTFYAFLALFSLYCRVEVSAAPKLGAVTRRGAESFGFWRTSTRSHFLRNGRRVPVTHR